jgi:hypothetical protein
MRQKNRYADPVSAFTLLPHSLNAITEPKCIREELLLRALWAVGACIQRHNSNRVKLSTNGKKAKRQYDPFSYSHRNFSER